MSAKAKIRIGALFAAALILVLLLRLLTGGGGVPVARSGAPPDPTIASLVGRIEELERRERANAAAGSLDAPARGEARRMQAALAARLEDDHSFARAALASRQPAAMELARARLAAYGDHVPTPLRAEHGRLLAALRAKGGSAPSPR